MNLTLSDVFTQPNSLPLAIWVRKKTNHMLKRLQFVHTSNRKVTSCVGLSATSFTRVLPPFFPGNPRVLRVTSFLFVFVFLYISRLSIFLNVFPVSLFQSAVSEPQADQNQRLVTTPWTSNQKPRNMDVPSLWGCLTSSPSFHCLFTVGHWALRKQFD